MRGVKGEESVSLSCFWPFYDQKLRNERMRSWSRPCFFFDNDQYWLKSESAISVSTGFIFYSDLTPLAPGCVSKLKVVCKWDSLDESTPAERWTSSSLFAYRTAPKINADLKVVPGHRGTLTRMQMRKAVLHTQYLPIHFKNVFLFLMYRFVFDYNVQCCFLSNASCY